MPLRLQGIDGQDINMRQALGRFLGPMGTQSARRLRTTEWLPASPAHVTALRSCCPLLFPVLACSKFKGKVLLIINVASACGELKAFYVNGLRATERGMHAAGQGRSMLSAQPVLPCMPGTGPTTDAFCPSLWAGFTPQYTEMTELYNKYSKQGLEVLAFPCNQVGLEGGRGAGR